MATPKEQTSALAKALAAKLNAEENAVQPGVVTGTSSLFESVLPDLGTDKEEVARVDNARSVFAAAAVLAVGEIFLEQAKADPNAKVVSATFNIGGNSTLEFDVHREKTYNQPPSRDEAGNTVAKPPVVKQGAIDGFSLRYAPAQNVGELAAARQFVNQSFTDAMSADK